MLVEKQFHVLVSLTQLVGIMHKIYKVRDSNLVHYQKKEQFHNFTTPNADFIYLYLHKQIFIYLYEKDDMIKF